MSPAERILVLLLLSVLGGNIVNTRAQSTGKTKSQEAKTGAKAGAKPDAKAGAKVEATAGAKAEVKASTLAGVRYDPAGHPDPFLNLLALRKRTEEANMPVESTAVIPGIGGMRISEVAFIGTSLHEGTYTAVLRGSDKRVYFLREGERLRDGYVKRIQGDSVVFVQETKLRSGKVMTQEIARQLRPT